MRGTIGVVAAGLSAAALLISMAVRADECVDDPLIDECTEAVVTEDVTEVEDAGYVCEQAPERIDTPCVAACTLDPGVELGWPGI